MASKFFNYATTALNTRFTPSTARDISTYGNTRANGSMLINFCWYKVKDIDDCAYYYHKNGYAVDENYEFTKQGNIFDYVNTRAYFNVLKCSDIKMHLTGIISDEATLSAIEARLLGGMRLWNPIANEVDIGNYQYDNVEKSYVEES